MVTSMPQCNQSLTYVPVFFYQTCELWCFSLRQYSELKHKLLYLVCNAMGKLTFRTKLFPQFWYVAGVDIRLISWIFDVSS